MNIDRSAFDLRRELGILLNGGTAVKRFSSLFDQDWDQGTPYDPPDPVSVLPAPEEEDELTVRLGPDDDDVEE
jgi:phosphatidylserine/phosphatidylglycerophosphate/cardiolipin synthase-like enzyme